MKMKIITKGLLLGICLITCPAMSLFAQQTGATITLSSSNEQLNKAFEWAKEKALSYVTTGQTGFVNGSERDKGTDGATFMPSYWAGYPFRTAFYSRDFCHQISGANLLGLTEENLAMMKAFAASSTPERKWYPLWAINFDGSVYELDYRSDSVFVREVPAPFELVEKIYQQYLWTGDKRWIEDQTLLDYCRHIVTDFIAEHDSHWSNGVAEGDGSGNIFSGVSTYNEIADESPCIESGDGIAAQYQAFLAYAGLMEATGQSEEAATWRKKAQALKSYFENTWSQHPANQLYVRAYDIDKQPHWTFGKEPSWFMPMKFITDGGTRNSAYLDYITESLRNPANVPVNIEAISYLPDTFFPYNRVDEGWQWMQYILDTYDKPHAVRNGGTNGDYPEVSYVLISSVIENLLGVEMNLPNKQLKTIPRLPKEITFLEVTDMPAADHRVSVRHDGLQQTTITHSQGEEPLTFDVRFYGTYPNLWVDGQLQPAKSGQLHGETISYVTVTLAEKECKTVVAK